MVVGDGCFVLILVRMAASAAAGDSSPAPAPPLHLSRSVQGKGTLAYCVAHHPLTLTGSGGRVSAFSHGTVGLAVHCTVGVVHSIMADLRQVNPCMDGAAQAMCTCRLAESFALHCYSAAQALRQMMRLLGQAELVLDHP